MGVSIVVGGQYGSEGKGKVIYEWAKQRNVHIIVKVGGTNSGHTVYHNGKKYIFRMLPTACVLEGVHCVFPAGSYIDPDILLDEIKNMGIAKDRIHIDLEATIITEDCRRVEVGMHNQIASTESGTGEAVIRQIRRNPALAVKAKYKYIPDLNECICDTKEFLNNHLKFDEEVLIEGTQGYGLSVLHAPYWPYCTGRDTTAAGFLSEVGLSPFDVTHIIMVLRSYPIRVGGNSGPLKDEVDWEYVTKASGSTQKIEERTSVTKTIRRVGLFDAELVKKAIAANKPNVIVLNHVDYFDASTKNTKILSRKQKEKIFEIEDSIGQTIHYFGNGENVLLSRNEIM